VTFTGGATSPNEDKNGSELYTVSVSDPGSDGFTVKTGFPDCGTGGSLIDDSLTTTANSASFRCRFADGPATPTVRMQVRDADEPAGSTTADSNIATRAVTVNNVAPVVNLSGPNEAEEGDTKTYTFTLSDPGDDTFSFVSGTTDYPSCGAYGTLVGTPAVSDGSFQCRFPDGPNTTDVAIKIKDDDGGVSAPDVEHVDIISVDIANVAPALTAPDNQSSDEGEDKSFALGSFSDPGPDSPWAVDVDWGDGSTDTTFDATSTGTLAAQTHTYADNNVGGYTVTVKVTDKNGSSDTKSFNVNVANVAPKVVLSGDASANEGATKSYSYTWTDPGSADTFPGADNSVDCGSNGTASEVSFTPASKQGSFKCTFSDDSGTGTFAVNATVTDDDGGVGSDTKQVDVDNVAPTVSFTGGPTEVNEDKNGSELYEVSVSDPGSDGFTVKGGFPDCGTGGSPVANSLTTTASGASFRCRFSDGPATPTVRMQVRDADEPAGSTTADSNVATRDVKVNNVAPVVNLTDPPNTAQEGDTKTYNFALSDPGEDTFSFVSGTTDYPSCGAYGVRVGTPAVSDGSFQCRFPDGPNNTDVAIKIKDDDGGVSSADVEHVDIINVSIANLAPALTAPDNQSANEGVDKSFALGSFSDPGPDSPWAVEVDWGDGSTDTTFDVIAAGPVTDKAITAQSHTYADNGAYVVTVTVTDKNGDLDSEMFTATVNNVAPTATFTNNGPVDEGSDFKLSLTNPNDVLPDKQAGFTYAFDCGDGAPDGAFSGTDERTCPTTDNGTRTVKATIKDKDGGEQEYTGSVTVRNVAPTVTAAADQTANEGSSKSFNLGSFADPGPDSPWAVDVDWGDSSGHTTFNTTTKGTLDAKSHTYADNKAGGYTVTVKVTDKDGGSDTKTFTADVQNVAPTASNGTFVFDPVLGTATAGFDFTDPGTADKHGPSLSYFTWSGVDRFASVTETNGSGHASDTRTLNPGCYNLTVTGTAKDKDLAPSAALPIYSGSQTSVYAKGFRPPIVDNERNIVKYGNVVPVKVALTNSCTGAAVTNVSLYIETVQGSGSEIIEGTTVVAESVSAADTTGQMRIADSMYIYNLATKTMTQGKDYTIRIRLGASNGPVILAAVLQPKK
jgi:hypothetical protein